MLVARQYLKGAGKFLMRLLGLLVLVWGSGAMAADSVRVIIKTTQGAITLELDAKAAPATVANFLSYVDQSGYDNTIFHRVIEGFMIQGGGHYRDLAESPSGPSLRNEADNGLRNEVGTIAMARMAEIDSATNQFFINVADNRRLDQAEAEAAELGALAIANGGDGDDVEHGKSTDDDFFNVVECAQMGQEDMGTKLWKHGKAWINEVRWVFEWRERW